MWIGFVTIFPQVVSTILQEGVVGRAIKHGTIEFEIFNPRDYATDSYGTVDDRPYGGGPGMVMMVEPLAKCVESAKKKISEDSFKTIYLSPQGTAFTQETAQKLTETQALLFVAGRYEGVDERFIQRYVDIELSLGDFVLSGGELPALVIMDAIVRLISGTLGNPDSVAMESYAEGLLDFPQYTRPRSFGGMDVPEILLSGDHQAIERWRHEEMIERTWKRRPDLLLKRDWSKLDREVVDRLADETLRQSNLEEEE